MLPVRDGVGASQVGLPAGPWANMLDFLVERFPAIPPAEWRARMADGNVVDSRGHAVTPEQAYVAGGKLFYYRAVPHEAAIAAQARVLYEDDLLVAADKPHFLPVTPSGNYLQETLLVRLRRLLGVDGLTPLHRLDRETAGVVLFAKQPATCARYHALFAERAVEKTYQAIAPLIPALRFPMTHRSTLVPDDHFMRMRQAPSDGTRAPNARTDIDLLEVRGKLGRFQLRPLTGKRHQLRVHMAALGMPIVGDRIYPTLMPHGSDNMAEPLRLLAQGIAFRDPITGEHRGFCSRQELCFPAPSGP